MFKQSARLFTAAIVTLMLSGISYADSIIPNTTVIPDEHVLINFNGTGLDWVYAGPATPGSIGLNDIETPDYRAAEGWRYATEAEWSLRPDWEDFIRPGYTVDPTFWDDHTSYRFASEYWSSTSHVDLDDAAAGLITSGQTITEENMFWETFYVRNTFTGPGANVPEAGATMWYATMALAGCLAARRRLHAA